MNQLPDSIATGIVIRNRQPAPFRFLTDIGPSYFLMNISAMKSEAPTDKFFEHDVVME